MLCGVERPPRAVGEEGPGRLRSQDARHRGITVRDVHAGDLVVALVLEPGHAEERRVERGRGIAALCQQAHRRRRGRVAVVGRRVERPHLVEGIALAVQRVAGVLDRDQGLVVGERQVVKCGVRLVTLEQQAEGAVGRRWARLAELEQRAEAAVLRAGLGAVVGVAGLVEHELLEVGARPEHAVLGPLERSCVGGLGQRVGVERRRAVSRVVHRHPAGLERQAVGAEILGVVAENVRVGLAVVEHDRIAGA